MLNYGEAEFAIFEQALGHIKGGIEGEDKAAVLSNLDSAQTLWINIRRVIPQP